MIPDAFAPVTCQTCGAEKSHDVRHGKSLALLGRVFKCGASVTVWADGVVNDALICPRSTEIIAALRADNVRLGDRNVLLATELQAIADAAAEQLDDWLPVVLEQLPGYLHFARTVYDLAVEALEGETRPSAAAGVASDEPAKAGPNLGETADYVHSGGVS